MGTANRANGMKKTRPAAVTGVKSPKPVIISRRSLDRSQANSRVDPKELTDSQRSDNSGVDGIATSSVASNDGVG